MKFTLKIDLGHDYFTDDSEEVDTCNLARAIRNVSTLIWNKGIARDSIGYVRDGNGNTVGQWKVK